MEIKQSIPYKRLGIYEYGDVIIRKHDSNNVFLDNCTVDVACIREIYGDPIGSVFGGDVYPKSKVDFDIANIFTMDGWKKIIESRLVENANGHTFIDWLVRQNYDIPIKVLEYLKKIRPQDSITNLMAHVKRFETAKWLYNNGAVLNIKGLYPGDSEWTLERQWKDEARRGNSEYQRMLDYFFS